MDADRFNQLVTRLEAESRRSQGLYQFKVGLLALLGFAILAVVMGVAGLGVLLIAGVAVLIAVQGGAVVLLAFKLGKLLVFLALPLWYLLQSSFRALLVRLPAPQGLEVTRQQAPQLFAALDRMRRQMKGPRFHHVLLVDDLNAGAVQRPLFGLFGWPRNYLLLGLPLLDSMTPDEALAVVAHEYGHLAGSHGRFAAFIYRLRLTWATIAAQAEQWKGWAGRMLQGLVGWYAPYFNAYTFVLARAQEYQADQASAELVGARVAASALKRVNLAGPHYQSFIGQTYERVSDQATPPHDLLMRWADVSPLAATQADAPRWLGEALDREATALDTHPTLRARLRALLVPGDAPQDAVPHNVQDLPDPHSGWSAAQAWLGGLLAQVQERLQTQWAERVAQPWAQRHQQIQTQRERLTRLRAQAERSSDEAFELLNLQVQLEPGADNLPALAAFNAEHADHAQALFLEAGLRLNQGDAQGLALLDRVMDLDADAVKPACERAHAFLKAAGRHDDAGHYEQRWQARHRFELERDLQVRTLDPQHVLVPAELGAADLAAVRELLRAVDRSGIKRLYLARRIVPIDPTVRTYVLGLELTWWAKRRGRQSLIIQRLVARPWPVHAMIFSFDRAHAALGRAIKQVPGALVD